MEFGARLEALAEKAVEDRRRRRAIKASVVEKQTDFDRVRHFPRHPFQSNPSRWKTIEDRRERQDCQGEKAAGNGVSAARCGDRHHEKDGDVTETAKRTGLVCCET